MYYYTLIVIFVIMAPVPYDNSEKQDWTGLQPRLKSVP